MTVLSDAQIAAVAKQAGFSGAGLVMAVQVALAESGGNTQAVGRNPGSVDRGLWQINSKYHPEVSAGEAFAPASAAAAAFRISSGGKNWKPWSTYNSGAVGRFKSRATKVVNTSRLAGFADADAANNTATNALFGIPDVPGLIDLVPGEGGEKIENLGKTGLLGLYGMDNPVKDTIGFLNMLVKFAVKTYEWISDPHNWVRMFTVLGGGAAILVGLKMLADSGAAGDTAKSTAGTAGNVVKLATTKRLPKAA